MTMRSGAGGAQHGEECGEQRVGNDRGCLIGHQASELFDERVVGADECNGCRSRADSIHACEERVGRGGRSFVERGPEEYVKVRTPATQGIALRKSVQASWHWMHGRNCPVGRWRLRVQRNDIINPEFLRCSRGGDGVGLICAAVARYDTHADGVCPGKKCDGG